MSSEVKEKTLTAAQLASYGQVEVFNKSSFGLGLVCGIDFIRNEALVVPRNNESTQSVSISLLKPALRPMRDMTDEEVVAVCELADHTPFITKKKWNINRERDDVIYISNKRSEYSFAIYTHYSTGYGDVTVTRHHEDIEPETEQTSNIGLITQFYLERGLDCFGWIDRKMALDKTKL